MGDPVTAAGVAKEIGFKLVEASVSELAKGDVIVHGPDNAIGVTAESMPEELRAKLNPTPSTARKVIFSYRSATVVGIETANIKLICELQYNGPEVLAVFDLPADGMRSRLGTDTTIRIGGPMTLERLPAPEAWKAAGFPRIPVVHVPISVFVNEPWPNDNLKVTFNLVLSGLYGFGKTAEGDYRENYQRVKD
jgi:hypothetical protein